MVEHVYLLETPQALTEAKSRGSFQVRLRAQTQFLGDKTLALLLISSAMLGKLPGLSEPLLPNLQNKG